MYTVYIDLDGTLLDNRKNVSKYSLMVLEKFIKLGNNVVFATARSGQLHGLQDKLKKVTKYYILHNGGEILIDGRIIYQNFFSIDETRMIGRYLTSNNIKAAVIMDDVYYANYDAEAVWGKINNFSFTDFSNIDLSAPKFSVLLDGEYQINIINMLKEHTAVSYTDNDSVAIISPLTASKGEAVRFLQKNYFEGNSIYIGNDNNDISGFESCNIKVAVANAEEALIQRADIIIESNEDDGVAHYIHDLITQENQ